MSELKDLYGLLTAEQKKDFLEWVTSTFDVKATSVMNHWIYKNSVPDDKKEQVLKRLKSY